MRGKQGHADGRHDEPQPVQQPLFAAALVDHVEVFLYPGEAVRVRDRRKHFDRRDQDRLQPGRPSSDEAGERSVRKVRESSGSPGDGIRRPEFGVDQRQDREHERGQGPRQDRRGARRFRCGQRAEQPPGTDDRPKRDEHQSPEPDGALQMAVSVTVLAYDSAGLMVVNSTARMHDLLLPRLTSCPKRDAQRHVRQDMSAGRDGGGRIPRFGYARYWCVFRRRNRRQDDASYRCRAVPPHRLEGRRLRRVG